MFELDWQGDRDYKNRNEFMLYNPIYPVGANLKSYADIDNNYVKEKLMRACASYVDETVEKIRAHVA